MTETSNLNLLDYVSTFKERSYNACKLAQENLKISQMKMKTWYEKDARNRVFKPGYKVLVFLPIPGHPLQAQCFGPYEIESKISDVNYVVQTPGRRKEKRVSHVNMLKEYFDRSDRNFVKPVSTFTNVNCVENFVEPESLLRTRPDGIAIFSWGLRRLCPGCSGFIVVETTQFSN